MVSPGPLRFLVAAVLAFAPGSLHAQALTVVNGTQGTETAPGLTNHVWADPPAAGQVFDRWIGSTALLADPYAWHTTAVMPEEPATVTATYRVAPVWVPETQNLNGLLLTDPGAVNMMFFVPPDPVGVIVFFHGSQGSANAWFSGENLAFLRDAVAAGYGVVALDSADRVARQWSEVTDTTNVDVGNVQAALGVLVSRGLLTASTPKFAAGMSNGGGFAPKAAHLLGFNACAIWCSPGTPFSLFRISIVPTIWNLAQYDNQVLHPGFLPNSQGNLGRLAERGVAGELWENPPSPVSPRRFLRVPELSAEASLAIYTDLKNAGFLDAADYLLADPDTSNWQAALTFPYPPRILNALREQLNGCFSGHQFFSDTGHKVLRFFGARRPAVPGRGAIREVMANADGTVRLTVGADPGQSYRIETSTDLQGWQTAFTRLNAEGTFDWVDTNPSTARRFYRTVWP
jgi:hypothetical protein